MNRTGVRLRALAARWFDARAMELFIDPVLADLQAEYEEARHTGHRWRARWIWTTGHVALAKVMLWHEGRRVLRMDGDAIPSARQALTRTVAWSVGVTVLATVLQVTVLLDDWVREELNEGSARMLILLLPSTLPLSATFGLLAGILVSLRPAPLSIRSCVRVLLGAAAVSLASFVMFGWIIPDANQAFRVTAFGGPVAKGVHELTLGELRRFVTTAAPTSSLAPHADLGYLAFAYHQRWAASCAPIVLSMLALSAALRWRSRRLPVACAALAAFAAYPFLQQMASFAFEGDVPRAVAAWAPNAVLLIAAAALWTRQPSPPPSRQPSSA